MQTRDICELVLKYRNFNGPFRQLISRAILWRHFEENWMKKKLSSFTEAEDSSEGQGSNA
jgi:hypothetical protein